MECRFHRLIADVAVFSRGAVLMTRYRDTRRYDGQEGWFLPDDFLHHLEHPTEGARRILAEQVGLVGGGPTLDHIESFGNGVWHLTFHHRVELSDQPTLVLGENVRDAEWFALEVLPDPEEVAHHGWALDVIETMRASRA